MLFRSYTIRAPLVCLHVFLILIHLRSYYNPATPRAGGYPARVVAGFNYLITPFLILRRAVIRLASFCSFWSLLTSNSIHIADSGDTYRPVSTTSGPLASAAARRLPRPFGPKSLGRVVRMDGLSLEVQYLAPEPGTGPLPRRGDIYLALLAVSNQGRHVSSLALSE